MSRITVLRSEQESQRVEDKDIECGDIAGVSIQSNNPHFKEEISILPKIQSLGINLNYYINTGDPREYNLPKDLEKMEVGVDSAMGQIYASKSLKDFTFCGLDKFGTLATLAYGIRTFHRIEDGYLGLHSSAIRSPNGEGYLLVGGCRTGKTRLAHEWIKSHPKWELLEDDWTEIDLDRELLWPISPVTNVSQNGGGGFVSFGKSFFPRSKEYFMNHTSLNGIIIIGSDSIQDILGNVPFIDNDSIIDCPRTARDEISERVKLVEASFNYIQQAYPTLHIPSTAGEAKIVKHIEDIDTFINPEK
jgi:hypothetical protein